MANLKVLHKAAVISTDLTIKEIKRAEAIDPAVLTLVNENGEELFKIATGKEAVSKYGIVFENDSKISVLIKSETVTKENLEAEFGGILLKLSTLEEAIKDFLATYSEDLEDLIEIVDENREDVE